MAAGQIGLGIQLVLLVVVEVYNCIQEAVQIHHEMKSESLVLESRTMRKFAMDIIVLVSSTENDKISFNFKLSLTKCNLMSIDNVQCSRKRLGLYTNFCDVLNYVSRTCNLITNNSLK